MARFEKLPVLFGLFVISAVVQATEVPVRSALPGPTIIAIVDRRSGMRFVFRDIFSCETIRPRTTAALTMRT